MFFPYFFFHKQKKMNFFLFRFYFTPVHQQLTSKSTSVFVCTQYNSNFIGCSLDVIKIVKMYLWHIHTWAEFGLFVSFRSCFSACRCVCRCVHWIHFNVCDTVSFFFLLPLLCYCWSHLYRNSVSHTLIRLCAFQRMFMCHGYPLMEYIRLCYVCFVSIRTCTTQEHRQRF